MSSEGRFQIDITAKSKALSLQVRFIAAFWTSPVSHARRVTGSINARVFSLILHVSLTLLQVLGVSSSIASDPTLTRRQSSKVRYSLQVRLRNLWFRIRGKHKESNHTNHVKKTAKSSSQLTKSKSKRILVAVGRFWRKNKSFEKKTGSQVRSFIFDNRVEVDATNVQEHAISSSPPPALAMQHTCHEYIFNL